MPQATHTPVGLFRGDLARFPVVPLIAAPAQYADSVRPSDTDDHEGPPHRSANSGRADQRVFMTCLLAPVRTWSLGPATLYEERGAVTISSRQGIRLRDEPSLSRPWEIA